ncbi:uncharacterized protein LACBIDRAFT_310042 [Laccaria bicolor S238N-H82]|uniref:Predicted protein n=1 Tax=Laccaria bicolor (strain S238N-H82 / ATCC MYA-4686) TaxID=486041 RepID=B0DTJ0_LACBS|nr:uncharacterized protein LACBIDRAFT_310042 [Laccaria bicolor S238N-H82]EDR02122.1 predicted protein [Laccaria bicolor S238N-H82]|eukprot:XP_001887279.1 predicted protein [Laccaria bicolor S238N-H82]
MQRSHSHPFPILEYGPNTPPLVGILFNCRTTNRCATYALKHPGYWCIRVWKAAPSRECGQADA